MRKIVISLLLASVAASPAFADPRDREDRTDGQQTREERQQAREERRERQARPGTPAAPATSGPREILRPQQLNDAAVRRRRQLDPAEAQAWRERRQQVVQSRQPDSADTLRQSDRPVPNVMRPRTRTPVVSDTPRPGTQPARRLEHRRTPEVRWSTNWRNDHRYDWRRWRDNNRSRFNVGVYYDPFGWGYQPYSIGWRLWPSYYSNRYWINDPWEYRLPYAPPGYRWVRYWDDALLVDTWSGQVVDVIRNFFW